MFKGEILKRSMIIPLSLLIGLFFCCAPLDAAAKYNFKYATYAPAENIFTKISQEYAKRVEKASNGAIKITVYPNAALCSGADQFKSVAMGMVDMTDLVSDYMVGEVDIMGMGCLPLAYNWRKAHLIGEEARKLISNRLAKDDIEYLFTYGSGGNDIFLKNIETGKLPILKGMKIRASGVYPIEAITAIGAVPVQMSTGEVYMSVETGLIGAAAIGVLSWAANTLYDVLPVLYDISITPAWFTPVIHKPVFDGMDKKMQQVLINVGVEFAPVATKMVEEKRAELIAFAVKQKKAIVYQLTDQEKKAITGAMTKIQNDYIRKGNKDVKDMWAIMQKYQ